MRVVIRCVAVTILLSGSSVALLAQVISKSDRILSGTIVTDRNEVVANLKLRVTTSTRKIGEVTNSAGEFCVNLPDEAVKLEIVSPAIKPIEWTFRQGEQIEGLRLIIEYLIPPLHDGLVITAAQLDPAIDRRQSAVFTGTLFSRDDQLFHLLDAGINAGQHEGGGKSLEIRRFGFNTDHGGVNGGLKVLVDNFQQNQGTQGHGQGYLGQLKSLSPELVEEVHILNGPFSAEYGDFSGLGVVHIRLKETLPDLLTARVQGGTFDTFRSFLGYSPSLTNARALVTYEASRTDGPFRNPLNYARDNITGNYTRQLSKTNTFGFKTNLGRNDFTSSGQLPLDLVAVGQLDRFGFIDPDNGGRVRTAVVTGYFRHETKDGSVLKIDGFLARSLFDLWSNFTFFLNDEVNGDEIRQHDSRLQEGANVQYLHPVRLFGNRALLTVGANYHDNQINVGLDRSISRSPFEVSTKANARVTNEAAYASQSLDLIGGRLHLEGGIRFDYFRFHVDDRVNPLESGTQGSSRFQPKASIALTPARSLPLTFYLNYGRGITSQDARGIARMPDGPRISTTDFYQAGFAQNYSRFSVSSDFFLIDRSNEQVYIPDDGSFEFRGPSRSYGFELKTAFRLTKDVAFNGGVTRVTNAFYCATSPREYVDSAPHIVANAALTMGDIKGFNGSLRYRHAGNYRLDGFDPHIRASGYDVIDVSVNKPLRQWVDLSFSIDNMLDKHFFETQNYFESRIAPGAPAIKRIHGTPGYPFTFTAGITFRLGSKD